MVDPRFETGLDGRREGGITRRSLLALGGAGAGAAVLASAFPAMASASTGTATAVPKALTDFPNQPPFSFTYGGTSSAELLSTWRKTESKEPFRDGRRQSTVVWTDPETKLKVRWVSMEYRGFPTVDWTVYFENSGSARTPLLADVLAVDLTIDEVSSQGDHYWAIHTANGSAQRVTDFAPYVLPLPADSFQRGWVFTTGGGRPTNGYHNPDLSDNRVGGGWPYYNVDWGSAGLVVALGWPGQWAAEIKRVGDGTLRVLGGMSRGMNLSGDGIEAEGLTEVWLAPGESIRSPLVVLQPWAEGDWIDAQNNWRRWMVDYHLPRTYGAAPAPLCPGQANDYFPGSHTTADDELEWINAYGSNQATAGTGGVHDHWWIDAGWYEDEGTPGWPLVGSWEPDADRFPDGLKPVTDRARALGMKSIVWFEPERVSPGSWLYENHPEWLLRPAPAEGGAQQLFDFGNPAARDWAIEHFDGLIRSQGVDVYREDFNMDPLNYWNHHDQQLDNSASQQFSGVQGANGWRYQDKVDGTWQDITTYVDSGHLGQPQWRDETGGYVWPGALHPGPSNDTALVWVAPRAGTVDIFGRASKAPDPSGDGVVVRITKNDQVIWGPRTVAGADTSGVETDVADVHVTAGDHIRFEINNNVTPNSDSTSWDPIVAYPEDAPAQRGMTQIRHVMGHLAFWTALRQRHPNLLIDTCASGGRRLDILTLNLSFPLLRSDYVLDAVGNQAHNYGISFWLPMSGDAMRITGSPDDVYNARSAMAPSYHEALDVRTASVDDWALLRKMSLEWRDIAAYYHGAYYPLTSYSVSADALLAYQFQDLDGRAGFVQAFRRPANTDSQLLVRLRGLNDHARYTLTDYETQRSWTARGRDLATGLLIALPTAPYATTIRYETRAGRGGGNHSRP